jgi:2,3-bisphosphoglycerate-independent phosphoglycerate mutase
MFRKFQVEDLVVETDSKIVLLVLDGIGDIPDPENGLKTPLEVAKKPNIDKLAKKSALGRLVPVHYGITPGSGPGHLGLFGYDPRNYVLGRGVMEALGLDIQLFPSDVVARGNFVTIDDQGVILNRRGGKGEDDRLTTKETASRIEELADKVSKILSIEIVLSPGLDHRFVTIFRGREMRSNMTDSDPQRIGAPILKIKALDSNSQISAQIANEFILRANRQLASYTSGNGVVLRGFSKRPNWPSMKQRFKLNCVVIAEYPMYRGLAQVLGMDKVNAGSTPKEAFEAYLKHHDKFNFFFIHIKKTDSYGESGKFQEKVKVIEEVDAALPTLFEKMPNCLCITGDHSTPVPIKAHSWHPVPLMIHSPYSGIDQAKKFTEAECCVGSLTTFPARHLMNVILANALKLEKYGA